MTTGKSGKNEKAVKDDAQRVTTPEFRVSFPHVFKPSAIKGTTNPPKYSITMLFKKTQDLGAIKRAMNAAKIEAFGPNKKDWPELNSPVLDGDDTPDRDGYKGHWVIKATTNQEYKPTVVNENVEEIIDPSLFYPGCYAKAQIFARVYRDFGSGQGIHFILDMVQKTKEGKPFGGKKAAKEVFSPIEHEDDATDYDSTDDDGDSF